MPVVVDEEDAVVVDVDLPVVVVLELDAFGLEPQAAPARPRTPMRRRGVSRITDQAGKAARNHQIQVVGHGRHDPTSTLSQTGWKVVPHVGTASWITASSTS